MRTGSVPGCFYSYPDLISLVPSHTSSPIKYTLEHLVTFLIKFLMELLKNIPFVRILIMGTILYLGIVSQVFEKVHGIGFDSGEEKRV